jgi:hypothetical protein
VVVDDTGRGEAWWPRLLDYHLEVGAYRSQVPDADGRAHLVIADVWPGIRRDHLVCYDAAGWEIGNYVTVVGQAAKAAAQASRRQRRRKKQQHGRRRKRVCAMLRERLRALGIEPDDAL